MMCQWKMVKMETKKYQRKTACIPVIGWEHSKQITTMEYKYFVFINGTQTQMIFFGKGN